MPNRTQFSTNRLSSDNFRTPCSGIFCLGSGSFGLINANANYEWHMALTSYTCRSMQSYDTSPTPIMQVGRREPSGRTSLAPRRSRSSTTASTSPRPSRRGSGSWTAETYPRRPSTPRSSTGRLFTFLSWPSECCLRAFHVQIMGYCPYAGSWSSPNAMR